MIHKIYTYNEPILRQRTEDWPHPSTLGTSEEASFMTRLHNNKIIGHMWDTLYDAKGVGLAMPQIGLPGRLIVIDAKISEEEIFKGVFFNAHILDYSEYGTIMEEGCLSFPKINIPILRPSTVEVEWYDENWVYNKEIFFGLKSRILQHEIDHLEGILFIDRINLNEKLKLSEQLEDIKNKKV